VPLRPVGPNPFKDATVGAMLDAVAAAHPDREAIVFTDERLTFAEFRERAMTLARGLAALGIIPGDKVAIWLPNRPSWYVMQQACARLGAVVVGLNPRYKAHELSYILNQSDTKALLMTDHFGGTDYFETIHDVIPDLSESVPGELASAKLPVLRWVIVHAEDPYPGCVRLCDVMDAGAAVVVANGTSSGTSIVEAGPGSVGPFRQTEARAAAAGGKPGSGLSVVGDGVGSVDPFPPTEERPASKRLGSAPRMTGGERPVVRDPTPSPTTAPTPTPDEVFTILYTSGTTSFPKGAMITHRNCVPHAWNTAAVLRLTPDDRVLHALPAAGTWGGVNIPLSTWSHGACLVLMETFDPLRAFVLIERERCTVWNGVDAMARAMLDHPDLGRYDRSSLRTGGFGATGGGGHGLFEAVLKRIGIPQLYQPYGMTELNALSLLHDLDEPVELRELSGAYPPPGLEVRVVKPDTGAVCAPGEEGELQFRGTLVTPGYYNKPDETATAFTADGWFRSGDLGVQDADGHTFFKGRLREVLRINHFMVAPGEIEAFLMSHPEVDQAFVVGVPDPATNEAAIAYVILKPGASLTEDGLRGFCRGKIASYKIPKVVRFVKDVPRTPGPHGDKVQRGKLREQALRELGLDKRESR
jgi:acyl-CoA synthetase (AMP-forming)/AMP-acid ligase II